ncbi:MAG TPA: hypothetical protein PLG96_09075 [Flexilinea sp.]|nr:hypothetical protein [Flexilinea sp.]
MNKHKFILPVIFLLCIFSAGWYAYSPTSQNDSGATALESLETEGNRIANLASGTPFNLTVSDDTLTSAAEELMQQYKNEIETAIKDAAGVKLSLSNPKVEFTNDGFNLSVKAGLGFLKLKAKINGKVSLVDGKPQVVVEKIDVPIIDISADTVNNEIKSLSDQYMNQLTDSYSLSKIELTEGQAVIEGIKK